MPSRLGEVPDIVPVLSRGRHRSQRSGACFMEMASLLAGERWSDHPRCTHPLLGRLARLVNDYTSDACRSELAMLVPSVIGLTSQDGRSRRALQQVPEAAQWAYRFTDKVGISTRGFRRHTAPSIVRGAVQGIATACIPDPDRLLRELLTGAIRDVAAVREDAAQSTARDAENAADRMPWRRIQGVARR